MRKSVFLDELTDREVAGYLSGYPAMVLIPTGSTEQHGAHAPLGTDVIIPREVCRRVSQVKSALVAPPIPYGLSAGHKGFKGLAYVNVDTYLKMIEDITLSFAESGIQTHRVHKRSLHQLPGDQPRTSQYVPETAGRALSAFAMSYWDALPPEEQEDYLGHQGRPPRQHRRDGSGARSQPRTR